MSIAEVHRNYSHDWWTPKRWTDWVSKTFESHIWFDPCPVDWVDGNYSDGLKIGWGDKTYCNHPGSRGSVKEWWAKFHYEMAQYSMQGIWCAFSVEQLRHMDPSPFTLPGWLVMPNRRIGFVWGGPTNDKRVHGEEAKSPANWTVFWSSVRPAEPPEECVIIRTGWTE